MTVENALAAGSRDLASIEALGVGVDHKVDDRPWIIEASALY
jgi:hypothetical protein